MFLAITAFFLFVSGCNKIKDVPFVVPRITTVITGLTDPMGLETDKEGRIWVAQAGTGNNDGKVSVITKEGKLYDVINGLESIITESGELEGPTHLLFFR